MELKADTTKMNISESLGFLAGAIGIGSSLPQIVKIRRTKKVEGLSKVTWLLAFFFSSIWLGYGLSINSPSQDATNGLSTLFASVVLYYIFADNKKILLLLPLIFFSVILIAINIPSKDLPPLLFLSVGTNIAQAIKSYKSKKYNRYSAVSIHMLVLSLLASTLWIGYAVVGGHKEIVIITSGWSVFLTTLILVFELSRRRASHAIEVSLVLPGIL